MDRFPLEVGRALRRARRARGLSLRDVGRVSGSRFKPTSVAGYERGERAISLERFCELARLYGIAPERLLAQILRAVDGKPPVVIDLTKVEGLTGPEGRIVSAFVEEVMALRGERPRETIVLRAGDLEVLATASGRRPGPFLEKIRSALRASGPEEEGAS